jgi:hypothetical protein
MPLNWALKIAKMKYFYIRAGRVAQVVEALPKKCEALSSNSSVAKQTKNVICILPQFLKINIQKAYFTL